MEVHHPRVLALPVEEWPAWAWLIVLAREPQDKGLGDTAVHVIGDASSEWFKRWFHEKFGRSCGCTNRQRWMNLRYAYPEFIALQSKDDHVKTVTLANDMT